MSFVAAAATASSAAVAGLGKRGVAFSVNCRRGCLKGDEVAIGFGGLFRSYLRSVFFLS